MTTITDSQARAIAQTYRQAGVGLDNFYETGEISEVTLNRVKSFARQQHGGLQAAKDGNMDLDIRGQEIEVSKLDSLVDYLGEAGIRPEVDGWEDLDVDLGIDDTGHSL